MYLKYQDYLLEVLDDEVHLTHRSDKLYQKRESEAKEINTEGFYNTFKGPFKLHKKTKTIVNSEGNILLLKCSDQTTLSLFFDKLEIQLKNYEQQQPDEKEYRYEDVLKSVIDTLIHEFKARISPEEHSIHSKSRVVPGCWHGRIPSILGYSYSIDVSEDEFRILWYLPEYDGSGAIYRACPNIIAEIPKIDVKKLGLSALLYKGLANKASSVKCLYPSWDRDLKTIIQEDFANHADELVSRIFQEPSLLTLLENALLDCFDSFKNVNTRNEFNLGCGIQYYDSKLPSETQVYPEFYELFDKHPIPFAHDLTKELLARIVVNRELYLAKLYSGLVVHTGAEYKTSLYVSGPGNSFKTYFLEALAAALALTWYADGTFSYDHSINPFAHTFLKQDTNKGDGRFDDPRGIRRASFVHWTEEGPEWSPVNQTLKARTGTNYYLAEEKGRTPKNIPINAVNIYDSNHPISSWWFGPEGYVRCIPIGMFNPSVISGVSSEYYYSLQVDSLEDLPEGMKEFCKTRIRGDYTTIPFQTLKNLLVGVSLLHIIMTEGRACWKRYKNRSTNEISDTTPRSVLEYYRFNTLLSGGITGLVTNKGNGKKYNYIPLFLTLLACVLEPCNDSSVSIPNLLDIFGKLVINSYSPKSRSEVSEDVSIAIKKIEQGFRAGECKRFLEADVTPQLDGTVDGVRVKPEFAKWFEVDVDTLGDLLGGVEKTKVIATMYQTLKEYYQTYFHTLYKEYLEW